MVSGDLTAERELGRIAPTADPATLAPALIGAGHLLFADRTSTPPTPDDVQRVVTAALAGVLREG
ncbi:hypothetical protein ACIGXM_15635 [Kitasatospora sp. NPDC052896]|uniref:hypothetical protein n=1 Tax=Kitasatospora sp. NPDC052896 TaxID=3364061 RepID=UPI0037C7DC53